MPSLAGSGGEDDEAGSVVAETDMEDVAGVAEDAEAALGEEVDVASCIGPHISMSLCSISKILYQVT